MVTTKERTRLIEHFKSKYPDTADMVDLEMEVDGELNFSENKNHIQSIFDKIESESLDIKEYKEQTNMAEIENKKNQQQSRETNHNGDLLTDQNNFLIIGKKGSAKTGLGWSFAKNIADASGRRLYIFNYPKPELLKKLPFEVINITNKDKLLHVVDGVVLLDEASKEFDSMEKKVNQQLRNILQVSRQNNTDFIFICHNSYFLNRGLFSFVDVRIIKETNPQHWALERPYMAKQYEDIAVFGAENFYIDSDYMRGYQTFIKPEWYTEEMSTAYRSITQKRDFFESMRQDAPECAEVRTNAPKVQEVRHAPTFVSVSAPKKMEA